MIEERPTALPVSLTSLVGRQREIDEICALLGNDQVRLLTLTGPGGVGKTRLAIASAQKFTADNRRMAVFVDLAPVASADLVLQAIAQSLNMRESADESLQNRVIRSLSEKPVLFILDNFEHVIDAAPLLPRLLQACSTLTLLVTSRERLKVSGENIYALEPLSLPMQDGNSDPATLMQSEAVRLFVERAHSVKHGFALTAVDASSVSAICTYLEGLPLAIELAAARIRAIPPPELLRLLDPGLTLLSDGARDLPTRQRTMRNAIAWSYDLLPAEDRALFRVLAIFPGSFTRPAAEAVYDSSLTLAGLLSLADRSLLQVQDQDGQQSRFRMLQTVRAFGIEQLEAEGQISDVRLRHAEYFLQVAENRDPDAPVFGDIEWVRQASPDQENYRAALISLDELGQPVQLLRLCSALGDFWTVRGLFVEGRHWLERALDRNTGDPGVLGARALNALGDISWCQGTYHDAAQFYESSLQIARNANDDLSIAVACIGGGLSAYSTEHLDLAVDLTRRGVDILRQLAGTSGAALKLLGHALGNEGDFALFRGDLDLAEVRYRESVQINRSVNYDWSLYEALTGLGVAAYLNGNLQDALLHILEALDVGTSAGMNWSMGTMVYTLAGLAAEMGQVERSARLLGAAGAINTQAGAEVMKRDRLVQARCITVLASTYDEQSLKSLEERGSSMTIYGVMQEANEMLAADNRASVLLSGNSAVNIHLTPRELDVLQLIVEGLSDAEIAKHLFISPRTVGSHASSIYFKLGVSGRAEAAATAVRRELV